MTRNTNDQPTAFDQKPAKQPNYKLEDKLKNAQRSQRRKIGLVLACLLGLTLVASGVFLQSQAITLTISPEKAAITAKPELLSPHGFIIDNMVYLLANHGDLRIEAPDFIPTTLSLQRTDWGKIIAVTLKPTPAELNLAFTPSSPQSRYILENEAGLRQELSGASLALSLVPDTYRLQIDNPLAEQKEHTFSLAAGEKYQETLALTPWRGQLEITTTPAGAQVISNGKALGTTPFQQFMPAGTYQIQLDKARHEPIIFSLSQSRWQSQQSLQFDLNLKPTTLTFVGKTADGTLLINGRKIAPQNHTLKLDVNANYAIRYQKSGFEDFRLDLSLSEQDAGQNRKVILKTGKAVPTMQSPAKPKVSPQPPPVISSMAKKYTSRSGASYILFTPNEIFTMGTPRNEIGQRANEFLRQIKLDRPFYLEETEVTNGRFAQFQQGHSGTPDEPVSNIPLTSMLAYANWQSQKDGFSPVYLETNGTFTGVDPSATGYRLPLEGEWEWVARKAGRLATITLPWHSKKNRNSRVIPSRFANLAGEEAQGLAPHYIANYTDGARQKSAVRILQKSVSGLYNLYGNLAEVMQDAYDLSPPQGVLSQGLLPKLATIPVIKGADYLSATLTRLRPAWRDKYSGPRPTVGFRLARFAALPPNMQ